MKKHKALTIAFLIMLPFVFAKAQSAPDKVKSAPTELLAQKLVNQCANIKQGEFVLIQGGIGEMELLEDITVNVMKKGAHPLLTIGSGRIAKRYFSEVPPEYDSLNELSLKLFGFINSVISVDYNQDPGLYADVPPERLVAVSQANVPVNVLDGSISDEDLKGTFASTQVYLPAGEVALTPVPGTAEGKIVVDNDFLQGVEIRGLTMIFQKGRLVSMTANSGIDRLKAIYDAAAPGKEELSFLDIGINPNVKIIPGSRLVSWTPAGMVTIGIGNNTFAGGDNNTSFGYYVHLPECTLKTDGEELIRSGSLVEFK